MLPFRKWQWPCLRPRNSVSLRPLTEYINSACFSFSHALQLVDTRAEMADIYMDAVANLPDAGCVEIEQSHNKQLLDEIQKLKSVNREMFRQLMDRELQGDC